MTWLRKIILILLLAATIPFATSVFFQTGSEVDEWITAMADERNEMPGGGNSVYYNTPALSASHKAAADSLSESASSDGGSASADDIAHSGDDAVSYDGGSLSTDGDIADSGNDADSSSGDEASSVSSNTFHRNNPSKAASKKASGTSKDKDQDDPLADFSADDWRLILVNKQHPIPDDYQLELGSIHNGLKVDKRITRQLDNMLEGARKDGVNLLVISPYRNSDHQKELFEKKIKQALRQDYDFLTAYKETAQAVTIPGSSEHEIGLAVDVTTRQHITLDAQYAESDGGKWLKKHCAEYGFILRYPTGKEEITGIEFEPWHFRYVGKAAATYIMENNLALEEFIALIK